MSRLVADASAIVDLLAGASAAKRIAAVLADYSEIDVPEHFHIEALSGLRGLWLRGDIDGAHADAARTHLARLRVVPHRALPYHDEIWALRDSLSAYDAAYLALARKLDVPLLTTDAALASKARADGRAALRSSR